MNKDDQFPDSNAPIESAEPRNTSPVVGMQPKKSKKALLPLLLLVILLAAGGGVAWMFTHKNTGTPSGTTTPNTSTTSATQAPYFYLAPDTTSIQAYNAATKAKSIIAISVGQDEAFIGGSTSSNQPVQISSDGKVVAYATGKQQNCGEGGCGIANTYIYVKTGSNPEQMVKVAQPQMIDDWALTPDGTAIFYLVDTDSMKASDFDLHKITLADKKDVVVKQNFFGSASVQKTPLFVLGSDSLRVYDNNADVKEYSYAGGTASSKSLNVTKFCSDCRVEYGQPLSPDGKTLILESGSVGGTYSYYTLDLTNGTNKQIVKTALTTEQLLGVYWAPDGKSIAYDLTANGSAGQNDKTFKFRFEIYDLATGKTTAGPTDQSPGVSDQNYSKHFVSLLGWSPDATYIAYSNQDTIKLYKTADASTIDTSLGTTGPLSSNVGFGWYKK